MKNKTFRILLVILALVTALSFASCASAKESVNDMLYVDTESPSVGMTGDKLTSTDLPADIAERKIIKTYELNAETKEFDATVSALAALVAEHGGYVESNSVTNRNYSSKMARYASYKFRIPAENAEAFVNSIGNTLNVTRNNSYTEDVSESYYSIEATMEELQIERDSLLAMMQSIDTQKDYNFWLTIQTRLSEVRQQIARYQAQLNNYDSRVEYSTVSLYINEVVEYTPAEELSFGEQLGAAFVDGWATFCDFVVDFAIWFAEALPFIVLFVVVFIPVILILRRARRKRKERKLALQQQK